MALDKQYYDLMSVYQRIRPGDFAFVRTDLNVPHSKEVIAVSEHRIRKAGPTLRRLSGLQARIIVCTHWQEGKKCFDVAELAPIIRKHANADVIVADKDCIGAQRKELQSRIKPGQILLLQNVRIHHEEEEKNNDKEFAKELIDGCQFYINDAPGTSHRKHASIMAAEFFGVQHRGAGDLLKEEFYEFISIRNRVLDLAYQKDCRQNNRIPLLVVAGGAKLDKIKSLPEILALPGVKAIVGGRVGHAIARYKELITWGKMPEDPKIIAMIDKIDLSQGNVLLPIDHLTYESKKGSDIWDIGPETVNLFETEIRMAEIIFANAVMGFAEQDCCDATSKILKTIANINKNKPPSSRQTHTVMGGGETSSFLAKYKIPEDNFSKISPSGGAGLELLANGMLPGIWPLVIQK